MNLERELLEEYLISGRLMQVATISDSGEPAVCNVWYCVRFRPDTLYFVSRRDREHSKNVRQDGRIAGSVVAISLEGLGQKVRGVTFKGQAAEIEAEPSAWGKIDSFLARWPQARSLIKPDPDDYEASPARLYEILVSEWVLFDEVNYPADPRRVIPAAHR